MNKILQDNLNQHMINIIGNYTNEFKRLNVITNFEVINTASRMGCEMFGYFPKSDNHSHFDKTVLKLSIIHKIWCIEHNHEYFRL